MKNLKYLLLILPFIFISNVKAKDMILDLGNDFSVFKEYFSDEEIDTELNFLVNEYKEKYATEYPYYYIVLNYYDKNLLESFYLDGDCIAYFDFSLFYYKTKPVFSGSGTGSSSGGGYGGGSYTYLENFSVRTFTADRGVITVRYARSRSTSVNNPYMCSTNFERSVVSNDYLYTFVSFSFVNSIFRIFYPFYSNFEINYVDFRRILDEEKWEWYEKTPYNDMYVPLIDEPSKYRVFSLDSEDYTEFTFSQYADYYNYDVDFYNSNSVEVNLNDYPYIALSLKDYNKTEEFSVTNYVKGQYCLTSVYDYGLKERKDILSGTQMQGCSLVYENFTPVRTYILKSDLENHAIYYLKAYDTSIENKVRIDTSIFNIHYITEEDKDNPILNINGKNYTTIPYDDLTDTSTKSEEEGYVSGASCAVGDFNCTANFSGSNFSWSDIFNSPLNFLKEVWSSIVQVFVLISYFISILPLPLQSFLYLSFSLAIILGLIKILL